jgi:LysM repeat protein
MPLKKRLLLLSSLFFLSLFSMASMHSEPDNSSIADTLRIHHFNQNHILLTDSIISYGKFFLNTPYHFGSPGISSFDCSGFTSHVYRNFGYNLGRSSNDQAKQFDSIDRTQLKAGDLVFFSGRRKSKKVGHVGIVVAAKENGEFDFIHAAVHKGVTISNSNEEYYTKRFLKASRVVNTNQVMTFPGILGKNDNQNKEMLSLTPTGSSTQTIKKIIPAEYHHVKSGETLSSISKKYGISVAELKRKNNIKGNKLKIKEDLLIKNEETELIVQEVKPPADNKASINTGQNIASNQSTNSHKVKKGETLFSISRLYNISVDELKSINNMIKGKLHPGQKLKIIRPVEPTKNETLAKVEEPAKPASSTKNEVLAKVEEPVKPVTSKPANHKVISGESLFSIAKEYNIPVEELKKINNITNEKIHPGEELKLNPVNENNSRNLLAEKADKKQDVKAENREKTLTHIIKKGENLGSIAKNNHTTVEELKRINNLADSKIHQGQELKINENSESVKKNLVADRIEAKQETKAEKRENTITHKIKKGESLITIAKDNNLTVEELMRINNMTDSKIRFGQELKLNKSLGKPKNDIAKVENETKSVQHKVKSGESFYSIAKIYGCTVDELKDWNRKSGSKIKAGEKITVFLKVNKKDLTLVE